MSPSLVVARPALVAAARLVESASDGAARAASAPPGGLRARVRRLNQARIPCARAARRRASCARCARPVALERDLGRLGAAARRPAVAPARRLARPGALAARRRARVPCPADVRRRWLRRAALRPLPRRGRGAVPGDDVRRRPEALAPSSPSPAPDRPSPRRRYLRGGWRRWSARSPLPRAPRRARAPAPGGRRREGVGWAVSLAPRRCAPSSSSSPPSVSGLRRAARRARAAAPGPAAELSVLDLGCGPLAALGRRFALGVDAPTSSRGSRRSSTATASCSPRELRPPAAGRLGRRPTPCSRAGARATLDVLPRMVAVSASPARRAAASAAARRSTAARACPAGLARRRGLAVARVRSAPRRRRRSRRLARAPALRVGRPFAACRPHLLASPRVLASWRGRGGRPDAWLRWTRADRGRALTRRPSWSRVVAARARPPALGAGAARALRRALAAGAAAGRSRDARDEGDRGRAAEPALLGAL